MEIRGYALSFSTYLQTPLDLYHAQVSSSIRDDSKLKDTLLKVVSVAFGIIFYPSFGALYLIGRLIDWTIFQTVSPTSVHEKATTEETRQYDETGRMSGGFEQGLSHWISYPQGRNIQTLF